MQERRGIACREGSLQTSRGDANAEHASCIALPIPISIEAHLLCVAVLQSSISSCSVQRMWRLKKGSATLHRPRHERPRTRSRRKRPSRETARDPSAEAAVPVGEFRSRNWGKVWMDLADYLSTVAIHGSSFALAIAGFAAATRFARPPKIVQKSGLIRSDRAPWDGGARPACFRSREFSTRHLCCGVRDIKVTEVRGRRIPDPWLPHELP